ncbi:MAG: methylmalonyl-CoA epimerase [Gemmatimonadota bacterium]
MVPVVDHIGIAVRSLEAAIPLYRALLGAEPSGTEELASEGVRVAFFGHGPGRVELLEPIDPSSSFARFLARRGPGVHHVCLRVDDVERAVGRARADGAELVSPGIRRGAEGRRVAFLHPRSSGGVLLELAEEPGLD